VDGVVSTVGPEVDPAWIGKRVIGDTMLGCGKCARCAAGNHHVCADRFEVGIRGGFAGALAEQMAYPVVGLHEIPDSVDDVAAAMVEPGGNALRAALACNPEPGKSALVFGPGTIGLLTAMFLRVRGVDVHLIGETEESLEFARGLGFHATGLSEIGTGAKYDAVVDGTNGTNIPPTAVKYVEPAGRLVFIGIAHEPTRIDTRDLVFKDVTAVGILSASPGLAGAIADYASGAVDPRPLVAGTVGLAGVGAVLNRDRSGVRGAGPKVLVNPQMAS